MKRDEVDHIRADVQQAVLEAQQHDPTVTLEILWRLFDAVGGLALADPMTHPAFEDWVNYGDVTGDVKDWAAALLRDVQTRAVSKVPYGEAPEIEPEDHR